MNSNGLFGIKNSNRKPNEHWGKNCFNSSFPTAIACYMLVNNIPAIYIHLENIDGQLRVVADKIPMNSVFNSYSLSPEDLYFSFESVFRPYQEYSFDPIDGIDLIIADKNRRDLTPLEVKLTVLPDDSTAKRPEDQWGCELVFRSATTSYCALGMFDSVRENAPHIREIFEGLCSSIQTWNNNFELTHKTPEICQCIDDFQKEYYFKQKPLLMQTIWKTKGKSPLLADQAFDVVVWSDYAFSRLFLDNSKTIPKTEKMSRPMRATARLARCLWELSKSKKIRLNDIYRQMTFDIQNDKEFSINGITWRKYVNSPRIQTPELPQTIIRKIIKPECIQLLSPERRFDQTLYFTALNQ